MVADGTLSHAVKDIQELLAPGLKEPTGMALGLLDDDGGLVEAGRNYAIGVEEEE